VRFPNHGGLTVGHLDAAVGVPRRLFAMPCKRGPLPNYGGLTVAALVHMRLCIAKGVIFPANERRALRQERGGVSRPWIQSAGERETRKVIAWQSQTRFGKPRRADARRSCKRAFVYRTSRSFAGKCPHR
jgi:hypothetical protein